MFRSVLAEGREGAEGEPVTGIEPASQPWEGRILPMNYTGAAGPGGPRRTTLAGAQISMVPTRSSARVSTAETGRDMR
jgi:hypothetical protein